MKVGQTDSDNKTSFYNFISQQDGLGFRALQSYFIKSVLLLETAHFDLNFETLQLNNTAQDIPHGGLNSDALVS